MSPVKVRKSRSPTSLNMTKPISSDSPFLINQDWASTVEGDSASVSRARHFLFHILGLLRQVGCFLFHCMGIFEKAKIFHILGIFWQARWFFFLISIWAGEIFSLIGVLFCCHLIVRPPVRRLMIIISWLIGANAAILKFVTIRTSYFCCSIFFYVVLEQLICFLLETMTTRSL